MSELIFVSELIDSVSFVIAMWNLEQIYLLNGILKVIQVGYKLTVGCLVFFSPFHLSFIEQLWLRGAASVLLSEGRWFDSPCVHVQVSLSKILNPKLLLMCLLAPSRAATAISVWMYAWITISHFGQMCLLNVLNIKLLTLGLNDSKLE